MPDTSEFVDLLNAAAGIQRMVQPFSKAVEVLQTYIQLENKIPPLQEIYDNLIKSIEDLQKKKDSAVQGLATYLTEVNNKRNQAEVEARNSVNQLLRSKDSQIEEKNLQIKNLAEALELAQKNHETTMSDFQNKIREAQHQLEKAQRDYEEFVAKLKG
jgi:chromosome segregation ATPase